MTGLTQITSFIEWLLDSLSEFLGSEPIIYLFGIVCFGYVVRVVIDLIRYR